MNKMTTPKFMQFDEAKAIEAYDDSTGQGCFDQCLHMARYQHQRDLVVMKKLWDALQTQKKALEYIIEPYDCDLEALNDFHVRKAATALASVETMIKSLD